MTRAQAETKPNGPGENPQAKSDAVHTGGREVTRKIGSNLTWLGLTEMVARLTNLLTAPYLARTLAPVGIGQMSFAGTYVSYFSAAASFGFDPIGMREVAHRPDEVRTIVGRIMGARMVLALAAVVACGALLAAVHLPLHNKVLCLIALAGVPLGIGNVGFVYQGLTRTWVLTARAIAGSFLSVTCLFTLIHRPEDVTLWMTIGLLLGAFFTLLIMGYFIHDYGWPTISLSPRSILGLIRESWPIALSGICIQVYYRFDTVLIGLWRTDEELGIYAASYSLVLVLTGLQVLVNQAIFPVMSQLWGTDPERLKRFVPQAMAAMACASAFVLVAGYSLSGPLVILFLSRRFVDSIPVFQILIFAVALIYNETVTAPLLYAIHRQHDHLKCVIVGACVNTGANLLLIPRYGMIGAAWTTVLAEVFVCSTLLWYARRSLRFALRPLVACWAVLLPVVLVGLLAPKPWGAIAALIFITVFAARLRAARAGAGLVISVVRQVIQSLRIIKRSGAAEPIGDEEVPGR